MLQTLTKLASFSAALRKSVLEKRAVIGVLGTLAGKAALTAASHPIGTLTGLAAAQGAKGEYQKNIAKFNPAAHGVMSGQQVPVPPGVR